MTGTNPVTITGRLKKLVDMRIVRRTLHEDDKQLVTQLTDVSRDLQAELSISTFRKKDVFAL